MCGIIGLYNIKSAKEIDEHKFWESVNTIIHRGPDNQSIKRINEDVVFGHVRLSIIDLQEASNQPFIDESENFTLVFNGEIFNYLEIKVELEEKGYHFRTVSDTEVLLKSYIEWGEKCVQKFNGMWAFAIYDKINHRLFCSRDRFGIKPFNYTIVDEQFFFASEIKAILSYFPKLRVPNYNVIANYCRKSTGAQIKETWFKDVLRLEPAHNLIIDSSGININRYWDYPREVNKELTLSNAVLEYKRLLSDAVQLRMRSDVPVGFTLSSGLDSTALVGILRNKFNGNKNTYTASFNSTEFHSSEKQIYKYNLEINEPAIVKKMAQDLDLDPTFIEIQYDNYVKDLRKIIYHLESGHSSPAVIPLFQIFDTAKNDVKVVLEGQGADEMLGGYINKVLPIYFLEMLGQLKIRSAYNEFKIFIKSYSIKIAFMVLIRQSNIGVLKRLYYKISGMESLLINELGKYKEIKDYPNDPVGFDNALNKHLYKEHTGLLVDLLHYGDRVSMAHSIESRVPFMDFRLVEFAFTLPSKYKIHNGLGKYIHRTAMKGIVPEYILNNPIKLGFDSPVSHLFKKEDESSPKSILLSEKCLNRGLFSSKALIKTFDEHKSGKKNHSRILYRMLSVELWFREFIDIN